MITVYYQKGEEKQLSYRLLRHMLAECGYKEEPILFKNSFGKPYLQNFPLFFNSSNSGGYTVVALSDQEIGVDIQVIKPISAGVCKRFLQTQAVDPTEQTLLWTQYESYGKFLGCGIPISLPQKQHIFQTVRLDNCLLTICTEKAEEWSPVEYTTP
jgi:4'-phosphopantetheinyl transferase